jgi:uncharacterized protein
VEPVSEEDRQVLAWQLGRRPRALAGIGARCPHGAPCVLVQAPYDDDGEPFPTTFWLSCPALVRRVSAIEADGGVRRYKERVEGDAELRESVARSEQRVAAIRTALLPPDAQDPAGVLAAGFAGGAPGAPFKCLHAHVEVALAAPPHRLGDEVVAACGFPDRCCSLPATVPGDER